MINITVNVPQHILFPFVIRVNIFFKKLYLILPEVLFKFPLPRITRLIFPVPSAFSSLQCKFWKIDTGYIFWGVTVTGCLTQQESWIYWSVVRIFLWFARLNTWRTMPEMSTIGHLWIKGIFFIVVTSLGSVHYPWRGDDHVMFLHKTW